MVANLVWCIFFGGFVEQKNLATKLVIGSG